MYFSSNFLIIDFGLIFGLHKYKERKTGWCFKINEKKIKIFFRKMFKVVVDRYKVEKIGNSLEKS